MKKFLAILLALVMVLSLAACGDKPAEQNPQQSVDESDPRMIGMLVFGTEAAVNVSYDNEGNVLGLEGANAEGVALIESYTGYEGTSCADTLVELLNKSADQNLVLENVIIKVSYGSQVPSESFLNDLVSKVQAAADSKSIVTNVVAIPAESLDENGYINMDTAKTILLNKLGLDKASTLDCVPSPDANSEYMLYLEEGELSGTFMVNAITGAARQLSEDELRQLEGVTGEEVIPTEEENFDNLPGESEENLSTGAATEPTNVTEPADATEATEATEA